MERQTNRANDAGSEDRKSCGSRRERGDEHARAKVKAGSFCFADENILWVSRRCELKYCQAKMMRGARWQQSKVELSFFSSQHQVAAACQMIPSSPASA